MGGGGGELGLGSVQYDPVSRKGFGNLYSEVWVMVTWYPPCEQTDGHD